MENAERAIRKAIAASRTLALLDIDVFPQGSYRNRTNVRKESDVDICLRLRNSFHYTLPSGVTIADVGINVAAYTLATFKNDVETALSDYFGVSAVTRGNKAFDIHANTYRVDADVVPVLEYREYYREPSAFSYRSGVWLGPDVGSRILNYPDQHYAEGVANNDRSRRHFKRVVRIVKRLRNEMSEANEAAANTPSYLIECLVANVPEEAFRKDSYYEMMQYVVATIFNGTLTDELCANWREVNRIKILFHPTQPWERQTAHLFAAAAWNYIGFRSS